MEYQVNITGDQPMPSNGKKVLEPILEKMANDFEINIEFISCHGKRDFVPEMDFEKFYIFSHMSPDVLNVRATKIKKLKIGDKEHDIRGGQSDIFAIEGDKPKDISIISDKNGKEIAVVHDSALYFLSDFCHCASQEELDRVMEVFKYVIDEATKTPDLLRSLKVGAEERGKRSLEYALTKMFKERLKKEELQLDSSKKLYDNYFSQIVQAQRKISTTEAMLIAIRNNIADIPIAMDKKWEATKKLENSSMYEKITFQRNSVKGITTPIMLTYKEKTYQLGKYEIELGFGGSVEIRSLWNDRGVNEDHPHVRSGAPCWGNMSGEIPKRIAESEFDVAFVEIYAFLKSYDQQNPFISIDNWPIALTEDLEALKM